MFNYSSWPEDNVLIPDISLDPLNPRLPRAGEGLSQRDIIIDLLENEKIVELASSIAEKGFFPFEVIISLEENKKLTVLEGNRRVAALKLLISPEIAPDRYSKELKKLSALAEIPANAEIRTFIAPSREAAVPIIVSRHTQALIESWRPIMKARYYYNLLTQGVTIEEISAKYGIPYDDITENIRWYKLYKVAQALSLQEDIKAKVMNERKFPISTLIRLYKYDYFKDFLGIRFTDNNELIGYAPKEQFAEKYSRIVSDLATKEKSSRSLNTNKEMKDYLDKIGKAAGERKDKIVFTEKELLEGDAKDKAGELKKTSRPKPKKPSPPSTLIASSFPCKQPNDRLSHLCGELNRIRVSTCPNAVGLLLRCYLELCLSCYMDKKGYIGEIKNEIAKRNPGANKGDWHPSLGNMLHFIVAGKTSLSVNPNAVKVLNKLMSEQHGFISIETMNLFAHNQYLEPDEKVLRDLWRSLEDVIKAVLIEIE